MSFARTLSIVLTRHPLLVLLSGVRGPLLDSVICSVNNGRHFVRGIRCETRE